MLSAYLITHLPTLTLSINFIFSQAAEAARIEAERLAEEERLRLLALVGMKRRSVLYQSTNPLALATNTN